LGRFYSVSKRNYLIHSPYFIPELSDEIRNTIIMKTHSDSKFLVLLIVGLLPPGFNDFISQSIVQDNCNTHSVLKLYYWPVSCPEQLTFPKQLIGSRIPEEEKQEKRIESITTTMMMMMRRNANQWCSCTCTISVPP
jgi:hypothetical protein